MAITFYHTPTCPQCRAIERMLSAQKVAYTSCEDINLMRDLGIEHTPAVAVDGNVLYGKAIFDWIRGCSRGSDKSEKET